MGIEIEKKYRLKRGQEESLRQRLHEVGATSGGEEFEENTLYAGHGLDPKTRVLRLRRVGQRAILTYKERFPTESTIKHQREDETEVNDPKALAAILDALGYRPALVYEKRRASWQVGNVEVVIDELPFGLYAEIEGGEDSISEAERILKLSDVEAEHGTYPELTRKHGSKKGDTIEARFTK